MSDVNQPTVSLANGTLSPDLRVNYVFGLVLGVNEFRQEQEYFLEKDYIYNRELHGYGTASGLQVTARRPTDNDNDPEVQITVGAGMAIDQSGRPIVVRNDLCARLGAWLAKWQRDHSDDPLTKHLDDKGKASLYVVASHEECEDVLVPVPGQPCSSGQTTQAPSRIRDSYNIDFRWNPPAMPAWDIVRCFAKLMSLVRIVPELPQELSDEGRIIAQIRELSQPCPDFAAVTDGTTHVFRLPAETAREALDRIFTVWTTEVRPKQSNLLNPKANGKASEAAILLARIDFKPQISGEGNTTTVTFEKDAEVVVNDEGRPYLLHTQLMQELLLLGSEGRETEREFATLEVRDAHTLHAWVHHIPRIVVPSAVEQLLQKLNAEPAPSEQEKQGILNQLRDMYSKLVQIKSDDTLLTIKDVSLLPQGNGLLIHTVEPMVAGARIELTFMLDALLVETSDEQIPLQTSINELNYDYVGHDRINHTLTTYTVAERIVPIYELVKFRTIAPTAQEHTPHLSVRFLTAEAVKLPVTVQAQRGTNERLTFNTSTSNSSGFSDFWELRLKDDVEPKPKPLAHKELLSFAFNTHEIHVGTDAKTLTDLIQNEPQSFVGYDGRQTIYITYEVDNPPLELEFATIQVRDAHTLRAWIHHPEQLVIPSELPTEEWLKLLTLKHDDVPLTINLVSQVPNLHNVFDITTAPAEYMLPGERVELTFMLDGLQVGSGNTSTSLHASIDALDYDYVGHDRIASTITTCTFVERVPFSTLEVVRLQVCDGHTLRVGLDSPLPQFNIPTTGSTDWQQSLQVSGDREGHYLPFTIKTVREVPGRASMFEIETVEPIPAGARIDLVIDLNQFVVQVGQALLPLSLFVDSKPYFWIRSALPPEENGKGVLVLEVKDAPGTPIISDLRKDPPSDNQLWSFEDGYVISKLNGYVLTGADREVIASDSTTFTQLTVSPKNHPQTPNQQWSMDTDGCLVSAFKSYVADIENHKQSPGTRVIAYLKNKGPNQQWQLDPSPANALAYTYVGYDPIAKTLAAHTIAGAIVTPRELVTFSLPKKPAHLSLWFHTDKPVKLPETILGPRGLMVRELLTFKTSPADLPGLIFSWAWDLTLTGLSANRELADKDRLSFAFDTEEIHVGDDATTLTSVMRDQALSFAGYDGDHTINTFYTVDIPPQPQPGLSTSDVLNQLLNLSTQPLVTITPDMSAKEPGFELWFHLNPDAGTNTVFIQDTPAVRVFAEQSGNNDATLAIDCTVGGTAQRNVFSVKPNLDAWAKAGPPSYVRFEFRLDEQKVAVDPQKMVSLREYSTQGPIKFEGYNGKDAIIVYVRVPLQ